MSTYVVYQPNTRQVIAKLNGPEVLERYVLTDKEGRGIPTPASGDVEVPNLGAGTFGVVVRANDPLGIPRALKFFPPASVEPVHTTSGFQQEIYLTNQQPFKHVIRIMDYGKRQDARHVEYGVYVMDFVEGLTLSDFFKDLIYSHPNEIFEHPKQKNETYNLLFRFLDELTKAIAELHSTEVIHMDIKPTNVIVFTGAKKTLPVFPNDLSVFRPFLTDLGAGKKLSADRSGPTRLIYTPFYFPGHLLPKELGLDSSNGTVNYERLRIHGRFIDLYCFARTVEEVVFDRFRRQAVSSLPTGGSAQEEQRKEIFWKEILGQEFQVLEYIIDGIMRFGRYKSADDLIGAFSKISRRAVADALASEVLIDRYPGIRVRVGKDLVHVSKPLNQIVDHRAFQRLKNINQLAFVHEIYPGGRHNRFSHVVLTFHLAKQYLLSLSRSSLFRYLFGQKDIDTILCAALLHDIGQYPFAHSIEDLRKAGDIFTIPHLQQIKHDQELIDTVLNIDDHRGVTISRILRELDVHAADIQRLVTKESQPNLSPQEKIARDIVNGTIDVDRVSYLRYDSYMTGVPYGEGIDVGGLIESLTVRYDDIDSSLAIEEGGVSAAEMVLAAIYWMYRNVYWHHTNRGVMAAIKFVVDQLLAKKVMTFDQYVAETRWFDDLRATQYLSDKYGDLMASEGWKYHPLECLLTGRRLGYRRIVSIGHVGDKQEEIYDKLIMRCTPQRIEDVKHQLSDILGRPYLQHDPEILVDIPLKPRLHEYYAGPNQPSQVTKGETETGVRLYVNIRRHQLGTSRQWQKIDEYSGLAKQISREEDRQGRKVRVFLSEHLLSSFPSIADKEKLEQKILEGIGEVAEKWKDE